MNKYFMNMRFIFSIIITLMITKSYIVAQQEIYIKDTLITNNYNYYFNNHLIINEIIDITKPTYIEEYNDINELYYYFKDSIIDIKMKVLLKANENTLKVSIVIYNQNKNESIDTDFIQVLMIIYLNKINNIINSFEDEYLVFLERENKPNYNIDLKLDNYKNTVVTASMKLQSGENLATISTILFISTAIIGPTMTLIYGKNEFMVVTIVGTSMSGILYIISKVNKSKGYRILNEFESKY